MARSLSILARVVTVVKQSEVCPKQVRSETNNNTSLHSPFRNWKDTPDSYSYRKPTTTLVYTVCSEMGKILQTEFQSGWQIPTQNIHREGERHTHTQRRGMGEKLSCREREKTESWGTESWGKRQTDRQMGRGSISDKQRDKKRKRKKKKTDKTKHQITHTHTKGKQRWKKKKAPRRQRARRRIKKIKGRKKGRKEAEGSTRTYRSFPQKDSPLRERSVGSVEIK